MGGWMLNSWMVGWMDVGWLEKAELKPTQPSFSGSWQFSRDKNSVRKPIFLSQINLLSVFVQSNKQIN